MIHFPSLSRQSPWHQRLFQIWAILFVTCLILCFGSVASADINPWIAANVYNPEKWDTAGPETGTPWLHPPTWTPNQGWGMLEGEQAICSGRWHDFSAFTGSWGGLRDELVLRGVSFYAAYFGQLASNPVGGMKPGATWKGDLSLGVFLDLHRLVKWKGGFFTTSFDYKNPGATLSENYVGNQFPVQLDSFDDDGATRLVHLAFGQQLFDNKAELVAGRLITGEDFASVRLACTSLNQAVCGNPINAAQNISFPTFPSAVWGARFKVKPGRGWYAQTGSYLVYEDFRNPDFHGVKFSAPSGSGALTLGEFGYIVGHYRGMPGLPGKYKIGGYYDSERLEDLKTGQDAYGTWGIYALAEQMLFTRNDKYSEGLSAFASLSYAPPDRNQIDFMAVGGLSYQGLIPGRPADGLALVGAYGHFSNDLRSRERASGESVQDSEIMLELNYRFSIAPWLYVQPDIQGIIRPRGYSDIDNAFVIGFAIGAVL